MNFTRKIVVLLLVTAGLSSSCKKTATDPFTSDFQNAMRENALIEAAFNDLLKVAENILMENGNAKIDAVGAPLGCITDIDTVRTGPDTKIYTIVFPSGCTSYDGKVRSGVVTLELTGSSYNQAGSSLMIRLNNFYINGNHLQGKLIAENLGGGEVKVVVSDDEGSGRASLHMNVLNDKVAYWRTTHKRTIYEGGNDQIMLNNKYYIVPYQDNINPYDGVTSDGKEYYGKITSALVLDYGCIATGNLRYPLSGKTSLYFTSGGYLNVDYGDGSCNYTATMLIAGNSRNFSLY